MIDIESTVDKFDLRQHFKFRCDCIGAKWSSERREWDVTFLDLQTKQIFTKNCTILLTAVGGFSQPREVHFPGMDGYRGKIFHTAEWDHTFDYRNKRIAVIGNGCSAAQVVPSIAPVVQKLTQ
jgi:cation diffusion facilitator CzcD-associated flavoprotein CzcO